MSAIHPATYDKIVEVGEFLPLMLKCPEAFNAWVFSEQYLQQVPEFIRNELGNLLGETYSNENITKVINENQNRKEEITADDICMQLIDNDCGYVFERD